MAVYMFGSKANLQFIAMVSFLITRQWVRPRLVYDPDIKGSSIG